MRIIQTLLMASLAFQLSACGSSKRSKDDMEWSQIGVSAVAPRTLGVNAYLWRAALETFFFVKLLKVDPYGGIIISDWYTPPNSPNERLKITTYIMDRALKADGLKVSAFRQVNSKGEWQYAPVSSDIERKLEDAILTRAREMRLGDFDAKAP